MNSVIDNDVLENHTYDEINVGDVATLARTLRQEDIQLFALVSGDINPAHLDSEYAKNGQFRQVIGHGMWGGALISALLGTQFPGPGAIYINQSMHFLRPVMVGDTITAKVTVTKKIDHNRHIVLDCRCTNQQGLDVIRGTAEVLAPTEKIRWPRPKLPDIMFRG